MNKTPRLSPPGALSPTSLPRPAVHRSVIILLFVAVLLSLSQLRAQTFTYGTDWMGNTFSGTNNSHVPNGIDAIAVTSSGTVYVNCWYDEAGGEVTMFDATPSWVSFNGYLHGFGRSGGFAIAANSTYIYVAMAQAENGDNPIKTGTNAGHPLVNGNNLAQVPVSNSGSPNYTAITGNIWDCVRRYSIAGKGPSAIPTYGYSSDESMIIVSTNENDSQIGTASNPDGASIGATGPIQGIAASGSYVWVSDYVNSKIHVYNASTMAPVATWTGVPSPGKMALDSVNNILWVVENENNNTSSSIVGYDATITATATPKGGSIACGAGQQVGAPNALAVDASHHLLVADNGVFPESIASGTSAPYVMNPNPDVAQIAVYITGGANPVYSYTFGQSVFSGTATGKVTAMGFHGLTSMGFDGSGNFYVACTGDPHDVGTGTYLRKYNSDATNATLLWQLTGLQFVGGGSLDPANPNQFYSSYSGYSMNWANSPIAGTGSGSVATWNMDMFNPGLYPTDKTTSDVTTQWLVPGNAGDNAPLSENHPMVFEVRDIGGKPYLFTDAMNMGNMFGVMRMNGNVAVPACIYGYDRGGWPSDATKGKTFYWNDTNGDGCMQAGEVTINVNAFDITLCGKWVDDNANIWTVSRPTSGTGLGQVIKVPLTGTNAYGVPQYNITTPTTVWVSGSNNITNDTDWTGLVELAYLPSNDTMILAGNTSTHTSGATNVYDVVRCYPNWSTGSTTNKLTRAWEADGTLWKGLYAVGSYVFASQGVNNVNAISVYSLSTGTLTGTFTPHGVSPTGLNDEDNPINVRVLPDGSYAVFQENDLTNNLTIYHWMPPSSGPSFHTTNVVDPNGLTQLQGTSSGTANETDQTAFSTNVAAAYSSNMGGVVNFDVAGDALTSAPAIVANYGGGKTLTIAVTGSSALAVSTFTPSSGTSGTINCISAPNAGTNLGDITFTMGAITNGIANEKVTTFAFTFLTQNVLNGIGLTVTATYSDMSTTTVTQTVNRNLSNPPTNDMFFGFVAPAGKSILSVSLTSNSSRANTSFIDDVGFITSAVP